MVTFTRAIGGTPGREKTEAFGRTGARLVVTFLVTLTAFAISLLCGIVIVVIVRMFRGGELDVTVAYRRIALPTAALTAVLGLVITLVVEFRRYRARLVLWRGFE